jgi:voltage-gated potassium channel Kch
MSSRSLVMGVAFHRGFGRCAVFAEKPTVFIAQPTILLGLSDSGFRCPPALEVIALGLLLVAFPSFEVASRVSAPTTARGDRGVYVAWTFLGGRNLIRALVTYLTSATTGFPCSYVPLFPCS